MRARPRLLSYANLTSTLALVVALSGVSYALTIPRNSVGTPQLKNGAVTSAKIRDGAVAVRDLRRGTLDSVARRGEVLTGQIATRWGDGDEFGLATGTFPRPLGSPIGADDVAIVPVASPTQACPGLGRAASDVLCIYSFNSLNVNVAQSVLTTNVPEALRYGFVLNVLANNSSNGGYFHGSWAYRVP